MDKKQIIAVDIRVLVLGKRTGVEEYVLNLLPLMIAMRPDVHWKLFYSAARKRTLEYEWLRAPNVELREYAYPNNLFLYPSALAGRFPIDTLLGGCDTFWSPHIFNISLTPDVRHVVSVHDLAFERYPEFFSLGKRLWHRYFMTPRKHCKRADMILASSLSTGRDLEAIYGIPSERITVSHLGVGGEFRPMVRTDARIAEVRNKYHLPDHCILYFGTIEPRKNIQGLIAAYNELRITNNELRNLKLVIAGSNGWLFKNIYAAAKASPFACDIIFTGFVEPEDKPALYNCAEMFAYPSFFEGFGFPPLEAMASGIPVITSNRSSLPEVTGDAAILMNPERPQDIAKAMREVLSDKELQTTLSRKGLARSGEFSWETCARRTLDALLAGGKKAHSA